MRKTFAQDKDQCLIRKFRLIWLFLVIKFNSVKFVTFFSAYKVVLVSMNAVNKAQGHMEMKGWFELVEQYRQLTGKYGSFKTTPEDLGLLNDMDSRHTT